MTVSFRQIASRLYGRTLLVLPQTAQTIESFVRGRMRNGVVEAGGHGGSHAERSAETIEAFGTTQVPRSSQA